MPKKHTKRNEAISLILAFVLMLAAMLGFMPSPSPNVLYEEQYYSNFAKNADYWFDALGWNGESIYSNASDFKTALNHSYYIYEIGHGGSFSIRFNNKYAIAYKDVPEHRLPYNFVFLCSCDALTNTGKDTWFDEINSTGYKILLGYTRMSEDITAWRNAYKWQDTFFKSLADGKTFNQSFNIANSKYPAMADNIKIYGNTSLTVADLVPEPFDLNKNAHIDKWEVIRCINLYLNT